ncbi:F0F1 ATP synthase subunit delta [Planctomonas psychrotolerans]|uniref:F0F1 ATP synthase subunit delta n=1 Tax=Planctomonas psychrotolerans TaxID=2528712 RepID=UPI00123BE34A|nr:F0F1 ATP synthase subunit delta [Planctomonas psychrotolerans]
MGSATREAVAELRGHLDALGTVDVSTVDQIFFAGRVIGSSAQLQNILSDSGVDASEKSHVLQNVFADRLDAPARSLLESAVALRWSSQEDLLAGIEELGLRASAISAPDDVNIEAELFSFGTAVTSNPELELAVGSKRGSDISKTVLVYSLLENASPQTRLIVGHLVKQPRGRRIGELLRHAATVVADESNLAVATVTAARPIGEAQLERLRDSLAKRYGRKIKVNQVLDPDVIGGLRVQIADDVIDGSVATKINDLRLQLAG